MFSLPFFSGAQRTYVALVLPCCELLAPVTNHVGVIIWQGSRPSNDAKTRLPTEWVMVRFLVDGQERLFHLHKTRDIRTVPAEEAPPDLVTWMEQYEAEASKAMTLAEAAFTAADKERHRRARAYARHLASIYAKSRRFWQHWKGPGTPPKAPDDPDGVDATNRQPPSF